MTRAVSDYRHRKEYRYRVALGIPTSLVEADPYREHLQRVVALGWATHSLEHVARDVSHQTLRLVLHGVPTRLERKTIAAIERIPYSLAVPDEIPDDAFVPSLGATRRVRALLALGWTRADVQAAVTRHAPEVNVAHIASHTHKRIKAIKWRAVAAAYDEMCMSVGPSTIGKARALKAGHVPPLGWNDVDDPDEQPASVTYLPANRADALRDLADLGVGITEACRRLHVSRSGLERWAQRNGMNEVYLRLAKVEELRPNQHTRETA